MKKIILIGFVALFSSIFSQENKYEVAVVGFYNLENLFDTDSSMQITNVDKIKAGDPNYTTNLAFDGKEYYGGEWRMWENISMSKIKYEFENFPMFPTKGLRFSRAKRKDYNKHHDTDFNKKEWKEEIASNDKIFSKKEFKELIRNNDSIRVGNTILSKVNDTDNTPKGERQYTKELYEDKLNKLASVISTLGKDYSKDGLALLGLAEIENRNVLEDLTKTGELKKLGLDIEHYDCLYSRGVDVALLYQPKYFEVVKSNTIILPYYNDKKKQEDRYFTRDILWVEGKLLGETVHVFVNHWPSRRGGETKSSYGRELGAQTVKNISDSLMALNPNTQIIVMGDLNDDPTNKSVKTVLGASKNIDKVENGGFYNPLFKDYKKGYASLAYRGSWNLFDQVILSSSFVNNDETWSLHDAEIVYNQDWINRFGGYEGGPNRSFGGNYYQGGYSDHLPSLVYLKRKAIEDKDKDGIADKDDECPEEAGLKEFNGCPDTDGDGIPDTDDKCPEVKGLESLNGCPDTDGDGITDGKDKCPEEAGPADNGGCPYADKDGDGVLDKDDKCPEVKGDKRNGGCPEDKNSTDNETINKLSSLIVYFDTDKSKVKNIYNNDLAKLASFLKENSGYSVELLGYTDNTYTDNYNDNLSKDRAESVKRELLKNGVSSEQVKISYFGENQPASTNDTDEGRQLNRRVEFKIISK